MATRQTLSNVQALIENAVSQVIVAVPNEGFPVQLFQLSFP